MDPNRLTADVRPGTILAREWNGRMQRVTVLADGFAWNGKTYPSLSKIAFAITGTRWNGPKFFGMRDKSSKAGTVMKTGKSKQVRCAIYTRVSTDQGLEQDFNSLDAQREACEAFLARARPPASWENWPPGQYDDGGFSGGTMERPALKRLLKDIRIGRRRGYHCRLQDRPAVALLARLLPSMVEVFEEQGVSFVSLTEQFNTTDSSLDA